MAASITQADMIGVPQLLIGVHDWRKLTASIKLTHEVVSSKYWVHVLMLTFVSRM